MRYSFRLAELIGHVPDPRKRPGTIKSIVEHTGLDRHQVSALLKNEIKYIPLEALSRLCDYLVEHGYASAEQLPGALFAVEPEHFWELLGRRRRLELCVGVRRAEDESWGDRAWVVASDSVLLGELLNDVSTLGGTAKFRRRESALLWDLASGPQVEHLKQTLVWSPGQGQRDEVRDRARQVYHEFRESGGDKALVCVGSTKSNPVVEMVMAETFGCAPYEPWDHVERPQDRRCPLFIRYRQDDPHPDSCCSGLQLSRSVPSERPGIYFEGADGQWDCFPCAEPRDDAAMVFYVHRESQGRLEMVLGGFSGRATRMLAKTLATRAEEFWPPVYDDQGIRIGAYLVQYHFAFDEHQQHDILRTDLVANTKIIQIDNSVIQRRLAAR